jgi:hypothetical protein
MAIAHKINAYVYHYNSVDVVVYGWFGELEPRDSNGELSEVPQPVQYVQYDEELFTMIADANIFNPLTFRVEFKPNAETTQPPQTEEPSVEAGGIPTVVILGVAVGGGLVVMIIFLIIVLVCVFGRRKGKDKHKRKKRRR